jgi:hypothetical protein
LIVTPDRRLRVFVSSTLDELQIPLGVTQAMRGDHEAGIALLEDSRARAEQLQSEWGVAMSMLALDLGAERSRG